MSPVLQMQIACGECFDAGRAQAEAENTLERERDEFAAMAIAIDVSCQGSSDARRLVREILTAKGLRLHEDPLLAALYRLRKQAADAHRSSAYRQAIEACLSAVEDAIFGPSNPGDASIGSLNGLFKRLYSPDLFAGLLPAQVELLSGTPRRSNPSYDHLRGTHFYQAIVDEVAEE